MPTAEIHQSVSGNRDFRRLWSGLAVSQFGSAVGGTALSVVAVRVLNASTFEVTLLAALTSATAVVFALPIGTWTEFHAKRPAMVTADVIRFLTLLSVPVVYALGGLTFVQLCVVAAVNGLAQLAFLAASQANLVDLVSRSQLMDANGRLQSSTWLSLSVGPSLAGLLMTLISAVATMLVDAVSYLASAAAVVLIRTPETAPPTRPESRSRRAELLSGLQFVLGRPELRRLLLSWIVYVGCIGVTTPLASVFYQRELHFTNLQYGLILGLPSLAGFAGSRLTHLAVNRFGGLPVVRAAAALRVPGLFVIPLAGRGWPGVLVCGLGFAAVLFFSSLSNAAMTGYRQLRTPDHLLARTATFWSFAQSVGLPVFILAGGALAAAIGVRTGLFVAAGGVVVSVALLFIPAGSEPAGTTPPAAAATT